MILNRTFTRVFDSFLFIKGLLVWRRYSDAESQRASKNTSTPVHSRLSGCSPENVKPEQLSHVAMALLASETRAYSHHLQVSL